MKYRRLRRPLVRRQSVIFCSVVKSLTKGAATGASIAGIVNTAAPGVIPTFCGYLVGKGFGDLLVQAGLITFGVFSQPSINAVAILGVSAAIGAVFGGIVGVSKEIWICRKRYKAWKRE